MNQFEIEKQNRIITMSRDEALGTAADNFMIKSLEALYSYNFSWLGRPIIQYPQDIVAVQELVFNTRPDLIIETGIAHGGSLILSASLLALLDLEDHLKDSTKSTFGSSRRKVIGVDVDIRSANRSALDQHFLKPWIHLIEGSSISPEVISEVTEAASKFSKVMVCLDSNHTADHVAAELEAYGVLTSVGCYCVVFDTVVEHMPEQLSRDRPWGPNNNPMTAVRSFLSENSIFEVDDSITRKLLLSVAPDGYLKRIR